MTDDTDDTTRERDDSGTVGDRVQNAEDGTRPAGETAAVTIDGDEYRVGTVLDFAAPGDHPRDEVWVLTAVVDGDPSFVAAGAPDRAPPTRPLELAEVRSAAASDDVDLYEVRPGYPPVGAAVAPREVEGWTLSPVERRLVDERSRRVETDGGDGTEVAAGARSASGPFSDRFTSAFTLARTSAAFDRRPEGAIERLEPEFTGDVVLADALVSERSLRDRSGEDGAAAAERARQFASATTEGCPRVAVPAGPGERGPFTSVPFLAPRVIHRGDVSGGSGLEGSPLLSRACRQAWYSPNYDVSLADADYRSGALTISIERTEARDVAPGAD